MGRRPGRELRVGDRPRRRRAVRHPDPPVRAARADRRGRRDHAVELPVPAQPGEAGARARGRQHRRAEAGARHAVVGARCSASSSPRRPTSRRASSTWSCRRTTMVGELLAEDHRVDIISFTGSTATGRKVMAAASGNLKKVFLELGGKSANIVLDDADIGAGGRRLRLRGDDPRRAGLRDHHPPAAAPLPLRRGRRDGRRADRARSAVRRPDRPGNLAGPLISARQRERVLGYIEKGKAEGAKVGARRRPPRPAREGLLRRADAVRRRRPGLDDRPGGDLRAGARR